MSWSSWLPLSPFCCRDGELGVAREFGRDPKRCGLGLCLIVLDLCLIMRERYFSRLLLENLLTFETSVQNNNIL